MPRCSARCSPCRPLARCLNAPSSFSTSSRSGPTGRRLSHVSRAFSSSPPSCQSLRKAYVLSSARTPTGAFNSAFKSVPAPHLATFAIKSALAKSAIEPSRITACYIGNVLSAGVGQSPARQASLLSGLPESTDVTTINKVCASGMKAVSLGAQAIAIGEHDVVLTGGMESMSRVPYYVPRGNAWPPFGAVSMEDGLIHDGLQDVYDQIHMGVCAERTAQKYDISRQEQDAYAIQSFKRAQAAWAQGLFAEEIAPVTVKGKKGDTIVERDEGYMNLREDKVPTLKPAFVHDGSGTVTAANSSTFNDGASAVLLGTAATAREVLLLQRAPKPVVVVVAEILASADAAVAPVLFPIAPSVAIPIALRRAGLQLQDVAVFEINEAFAAVVRANAKILGLEEEEEGKVNPRGGAISLGHALGSSGSRILVTLLHQLRVGEVGVAGICNGGGGGSAVVVRRVDAV